MDYHIHSTHSSDAKMTIEEACIKAIELGINEIAFTDHIDIDWPGSNSIFDISRLDIYMDEIEQNRRKFKGQIDIKSGIEIGLQPHVLAEKSRIVNSYPFDFVIASIHVIQRIDLYKSDYYDKKSKLEAYSDYYNEILKLINDFDDFDVLGHLDYIKRYLIHPYEQEDHLIAMEIIDEILKTLIRKGKGIEVNTSGYKHISKRTMPHFDVVKMYQELGGEILTLGSDAHSTGFVYHIKSSSILQAALPFRGCTLPHQYYCNTSSYLKSRSILVARLPLCLASARISSENKLQ